jgi:hypothetical protein
MASRVRGRLVRRIVKPEPFEGLPPDDLVSEEFEDLPVWRGQAEAQDCELTAEQLEDVADTIAAMQRLRGYAAPLRSPGARREDES